MSVVDPALLRLADSVIAPGYSGNGTPAWVERAVEGGLGAVCWFAHNVPDRADGASVISSRLHAVRPDLLVLSDEEGGTVTRIEAATGSSWPGNAALGRVDDEALTEQVGAAMAAQADAAGVDVMVAPVVDVNSDPDNPVIGTRSFGAEPALVARHGAAFVRGVQGVGVAACAKHWPGHGATHTDSHVALPQVSGDLDLLRPRDLAPFAAAVDAGVRCVLTAHVVYPEIDDHPATTSPFWLSLLREETGFDGVLISDALDMAAISEGVGRGPGAVAALAAGVDLLCIGNPGYPHAYDDEAAWQEVRQAVVTGVQEGMLSTSRLEQARDRVAALAAWRAAARRPQVPGSADGPGSVDGLGRRAAAAALASTGDLRPGLDPVILVDGATNVAAGHRAVDVVASAVAAGLGARAPREAAAYDGAGPAILVTDGRSDDSGQAGQAGQAVSVVRAVRAMAPGALVVVTGPDGALPDLAGPWVRTFGAGRTSADALVDLLRAAR